MLHAGVVGHNVHEDPDAPLTSLDDEMVEVVHGAELRRDGTEVRNVVPQSALGDTVTGESQMPSTPSHARWSRWAMMPGMSPTPSALLSAKERG